MPHCLLLPSTARFRLWQRALLAKMKPRSILMENNLAAGARNVTGSTVKVAVVEPNSLGSAWCSLCFQCDCDAVGLCVFLVVSENGILRSTSKRSMNQEVMGRFRLTSAPALDGWQPVGGFLLMRLRTFPIWITECWSSSAMQLSCACCPPDYLPF